MKIALPSNRIRLMSTLGTVSILLYSPLMIRKKSYRRKRSHHLPVVAANPISPKHWPSKALNSCWPATWGRVQFKY